VHESDLADLRDVPFADLLCTELPEALARVLPETAQVPVAAFQSSVS
jgi:FXSXX-COOH protein